MGVDEFDGVFELCGCLLDWSAGGGWGQLTPALHGRLHGGRAVWRREWCWWCWKMRSSLVVNYVPSAGWIFRHQLGGGEEQ